MDIHCHKKGLPKSSSDPRVYPPPSVSLEEEREEKRWRKSPGLKDLNVLPTINVGFKFPHKSLGIGSEVESCQNGNVSKGK